VVAIVVEEILEIQLVVGEILELQLLVVGWVDYQRHFQKPVCFYLPRFLFPYIRLFSRF
jgi:hypothetical protein